MKIKGRRAMLLLLAFTAACVTGKEKSAQRFRAESADVNMQTAASDIEAAKRAGAASFAPQELEQANTSLRTARERYKAKDYLGSRRHALAASEAAKAAKAKAESAKQREQDKARQSQAAPAPKPAPKKRINPK